MLCYLLSRQTGILPQQPHCTKLTGVQFSLWGIKMPQDPAGPAPYGSGLTSLHVPLVTSKIFLLLLMVPGAEIPAHNINPIFLMTSC